MHVGNNLRLELLRSMSLSLSKLLSLTFKPSTLNSKM
jgi:hypothetical protein